MSLLSIKCPFCSVPTEQFSSEKQIYACYSCSELSKFRYFLDSNLENIKALMIVLPYKNKQLSLFLSKNSTRIVDENSSEELSILVKTKECFFDLVKFDDLINSCSFILEKLLLNKEFL